MGTQEALSRRDALRLGAVTATAVGGLLSLGTPAAAEEDQQHQNGARAQAGSVRGFRVEIEGCPDASRNVRDVAIDELAIDARDLTTAQDLSYRIYGPGHAHFGQATIISGFTQVGSAQLRQWVDAWGSGRRDLRRIVVTLLDGQGQPVREYDLLDCFPTQWEAVNFDTSSSVQTETIRVKVGRIEFKV